MRKKSQCLKLSQKVAFNIASEASYIYNLSRQKFLNNAKNAPFWRVFENLKLQDFKIRQNELFLAFLMNFCPLKM